MKKEEILSARQLRLLSWCALLSPLVRQAPLAMVRAGGRGAWISGLLSFFPLLGMLWLLRSLLRRRTAGEGLGEQYLRALGTWPGRAALLLSTLWILFYAGFVLRAGADRFIATVYPNSSSEGFLLVMGALGLMAGLGRLKILGRFAEVTAPVLFLLFVLVFPSVLFQVDYASLLPVSPREEALPILQGVFPAVDTVALAALSGFAAGQAQEGKLRNWVWTLLATVALMTLLCVSTVGIFGAALTSRMYYPFFVLLRNIQPLRLLERLEPLLIAQWVTTDFLLYALLLHITENNLRVCLGGRAPRREVRVAAGLLLSLLSAFLCAPDSFSLIRLSEWVVPLGNAVLLFGVLPAVWAVGKIRKTI